MGKRGINYYHEPHGFLFKSLTDSEKDLDIIKSKYDVVKIYHNPFEVDKLQYAALCAKVAKDKGLYVIWTENNWTTNLTEVTWPQYVELVKKDLAVADKIGVDEFIAGNEQSIHTDGSAGFDDTNLPKKQKAMIDVLRPLTNMPLSIQEGWWKKDAWQKAKLGSLSRIHFTLYENIADFEKYAKDIYQKFGNKAVIGEWSTQTTMDKAAKDEIDWATQLVQRQSILDKIGIEHTIFCFRDTGENDNGKGFGLWKHNNLESHLAWYML